MSTATTPAADTAAPVIDAVSQRWSTRVFDADTAIDETALASSLEAARWASSAFNTQPWRFIVTRRGTASHAKVYDSLVEFNQGWAGRAGALIVFLAETVDEDGARVDTAEYDAGQAAGFFAVQAHASGLHTHQMSGFSAERIRTAFDIDERLHPITVMAVGALGDLSQAPERTIRKETTRQRRDITESVLVDD